MNFFRREFKRTFRLAWPIVLGNLTVLLMYVIDAVMVGRLGVLPLAGVSLGGAIIGFCNVTSLGISGALSPLVARHKGMERPEACSKVLQHGLVVALVTGVFFSGLLYLIVLCLPFFGAAPGSAAFGHSLSFDSRPFHAADHAF